MDSMHAARLLVSLLLWLAVISCDGATKTAGVTASAAEPSEAAHGCESHRDEAYKSLHAAKAFAVHLIGLRSDVVPPEIYALRCLTQEPDALQRLQELLDRASLPGQLYALVGLRALAPDEFRRVIGGYTSSPAKVTVIGGDLIREEPVSTWATQIERGEYGRDFASVLKDLLPAAQPGGQEFIR